MFSFINYFSKKRALKESRAKAESFTDALESVDKARTRYDASLKNSKLSDEQKAKIHETYLATLGHLAAVQKRLGNCEGATQTYDVAVEVAKKRSDTAMFAKAYEDDANNTRQLHTQKLSGLENKNKD